MIVGIIGAGRMGRWFTKFFLEEGNDVIVSNRSKGKLLKLRKELGVEIDSTINVVERADEVLICVPLKNFEEVIEEIYPHVRADQVIMDICSIKENPVKIMHDHIKKGITLGTHPVFGPGVESIKGQNFILTPINQKEKVFARKFKNWLDTKGANVLIMSPRRHDELMSMVLGLPHFIGLVFCDTILDSGHFSETEKVAGASYLMLTTFAEAVASEETGLYSNLQMMLPENEKIERLFLEKSRKWLDLVKEKDIDAFSEKMDLIKERLARAKPEYKKSYETMHKLLKHFKN